ncbi:MAG TPA: ABC transporter substrate-binding protein [Streptosporangiaceae bacterium]|nr:ABC transporter substrate-binding protein [Streptosporangiaceae bacterium]
MKKHHALAWALAACVLLAPACGALDPQAKTAGPAGVLTIANASGSPWTCGFNPFTMDAGQSLGPVYEPLAFVNTLGGGTAKPWLASGWRWSAGNRVVTFTVRAGVSFSNGAPLTAADVVFTFGLLKEFPALDQNKVWSVLSSVSQSGHSLVVMTFKTPDVPYFYYVADQVPIVSRQVWSRVKDPVSYPDAHPVGTGAYVVHACTKQTITYTANPHYWVPGEPHIATVEDPAFTSNDPATTSLATGRAQWGGQFIPNIGAFYLSQSPSFHSWFPPISNVSLVTNLADPVLRNLKVRQAISDAINRPQVSRIGEYRYELPANQAGIVTPTFSGWLDKPWVARLGSGYDPAKARRLLASAGYRMGRDGIMTDAHGHKLAFTVDDVAGYSDWAASVQVIQGDLRAVGIALTPQNMTYTAYSNRLTYGHFQLAYYAQLGGPTPYYELQQWLDSANSAPIGRAASSDYERYSNSATDRLINEYAATTTASAQHRIVRQLAAVVLDDVPYIPVTEAADWYEYDTAAFSGWPTSADPYAQPSPYVVPDWGQVLLHLRPK